MREEYNIQCETLIKHEKQFRKIGRKQIQDRALKRREIANAGGDLTDVIRRDTKALVMTDELCGLYYKINRCRKMLKMDELLKTTELLL